MLQSKVSSAARAFRDGNYAQAMTLYKELGELLGHQFFAANLALCQSRLGASAGYGELASLPVKQLRVAGVMDEFTFHSYDPECELLQLHPEHCIEQLERFKPHILFIESAWQGFEQLWKLKISTNGPEINACIDWCKRNGVPTLFWNKEDPVHFGTFIPLAKQVDYVFTTDIDCVPKYKAHVGHDQVYFLPFAAQPKTHNPIEIFDRKDAFNFAGSYYLRYPERQRDFAALINAVKDLRPVEIYDRNADNPHPHYTFPDEYKPMILGKLPFAEIDKAYKGYRYGINMNTIKQSQTMFARRVFELLASNTIVVSNFSRGTRLLFGELVVSSDNKNQLATRVGEIVNDELNYRKLRLLGLRKVMSEHTYAHRMAYIRAKLSGQNYENVHPAIVVLAQVKTEEEECHLIAAFRRQNYSNKRLFLIKSGFDSKVNDSTVAEYSSAEEMYKDIQSLSPEVLIGAFHVEDYYGEHYLTDLAVASVYSNADAFGKVARYSTENRVAILVEDGSQYQESAVLLLRAALIRRAAWIDSLENVVVDIAERRLQLPRMLAIDEFNYIENGACLAESEQAVVCDLKLLDQGVSFSGHLATVAEALPPSVEVVGSDDNNAPHLDANALYEWLSIKLGISSTVMDEEIKLESSLKLGQHEYLYSKNAKNRKDLNLLLNSQFQLIVDNNVGLKTVFEFQDKNKKKISHQMNFVGDKHALAIPANCVYVRFGLRVEGAGSWSIKKLILGSVAERPAAIIGKSKVLIVSKQYPDYEDLYRYGFLHSRVKGYKKFNKIVDIFKIQSSFSGYREFEGFDIVSADAALLESTLATGQFKHVFVHILDRNMWSVLAKYLDSVRISVWAHGSEIQSWRRREFEFEGMRLEEVERKKKLGENRDRFWRDLFSIRHDNLDFIFVSNYFADEVFLDLGVNPSGVNYHVIHNPIDTRLFSYVPKNAEQRKKILSIRPYSARAYANDLSVKAVLKLSESSFFKDLSFHFVGDGEFFDETLLPLRKFSNVKIEKRFLTQQEISLLHKENGIFLVPTRCDTQGVSRDEAMSSGLVPVTNAVSAVTEFVDESSGCLASAENSDELADFIKKLYYDADLYCSLSVAAAQRVRSQSDADLMISKELGFFYNI
ncbi:glycosyltransferase family protein [Alcaligenes faecalis]|uniref:glycosyltransferase family protein n=1 Tax=Alcaligenes faecalis TaxID=511 RepID=UPI0034D5C732